MCAYKECEKSVSLYSVLQNHVHSLTIFVQILDVLTDRMFPGFSLIGLVFMSVWLRQLLHFYIQVLM